MLGNIFVKYQASFALINHLKTTDACCLKGVSFVSFDFEPEQTAGEATGVAAVGIKTIPHRPARAEFCSSTFPPRE